MSLTRDEWLEMLKTCKSLERLAHMIWSRGYEGYANAIQSDVDKIKKQIQSVIGQMENN